MSKHGGDVYRNHVDIDFSINVNPLGTPKAVKAALYQAVELCGRYPDIKAERLKCAVSAWLAIPEEYLLFGNGASELFMAVVHGIIPKKTVIPVPSFYGYEYAAKAAGSAIIYKNLPDIRHSISKQGISHSQSDGIHRHLGGFNADQDSFCTMQALFTALTEEVDLLFLANPNNPTGHLFDKGMLKRLLQHCRDRGIWVVLDECFIEFSGSSYSMLSKIEDYDNLILVRAFTKIFSIPGIRLGYLVCKNRSLLTKIADQLPEWNLSVSAQEAGCICAGQKTFLKETENYIRTERQFLTEGLKQRGFVVFPSMANFILIYSEMPLYERLLNRGILIRDCKDFRGLCRGFYRIAIKRREENEVLLKEIDNL